MLFPVGNVGLPHRQVWWFCDTGAPPDGISAPGRILIYLRCSAPSKAVPKTENFMEEKFFRAIPKLFHSNPVAFLSQRVKLPSTCQKTPSQPTWGSTSWKSVTEGREVWGMEWLCHGFQVRWQLCPEAPASATPWLCWATKPSVLRLKGSLVEALAWKRVGESSPSLELKQPLRISLLQPKSDAILILVICSKQTGVGCDYPWQII